MDDPLDSAEKYLNRFDSNSDNPVQDLAWILRQLIEHLKAERKKQKA
jgi:hypothetical protein